MTDRSVTVNLALNIRDYQSSSEQVVQANEQITTSLAQTGTSGENAMETIGDAAAAVGIALGLVAGGAMKASMDFEKAMSGVSAATNASAADMKKLTAAALEAGKNTSFSATEAAKAQTELAKAGVSTADILGGALKGALDLAAAGEIDLTEAAELSADVLSIWSLKGSQAAHVADVIAAAAGKSSTNVTGMGQAIQQAGLVASQVGMSLEETSGVLAAFAFNGLKGSDAGTSLKTMLLRLVAPTTEVTAKLESLGIRVYDAQGHFVDAAELARQLGSSLGELDEESRNAALGIIFGSDAIRAANIFYKEGEAGIKKWIDQVNEQGFATTRAAMLTDNLAGDIERLTGSMEVLAIQSGTGLNRSLRALVQQADSLVNSFAGMPVPLQSGITLIMGLSAVGLLGFAAFTRFKAATDTLATSLTNLGGPVATTAATGMQRMVAFAGRLGLLALGFAAVGMSLSAFSSQTKTAVPALAKDLQEYAKSGKVAGEASQVFGKNLENLKYDLGTLDTSGLAKAGNAIAGFAEGLMFGGAEAFDHSMVNAKRRINDLDAALAGLVQSGHTQTAHDAFNRLAAVAKEQGVSVDELTKGLPQYRAALAGATSQQTDAISASQKQEEANRKLAAGFLTAVTSMKSFENAVNAVKGALVEFAQQQINAEAAIDDFTDSVKENGLTLDINTAKGRANMQAVLDVRNAAVAAAQAKYDEARAVTSESDAASQATAVYNGYIDRLRQAAINAGFNKDEVNALIAKYGALPPLVSTQHQTPGLAEANKGVQNYNDNLRAIPLQKNTVIYTHYLTRGRPPGGKGQEYERWGGVYEARTGLLNEAGIYPAGRRPMYAFAEAETGGEAFIPKFGDRDRSLGILQRAASWYGATVGQPMVMSGGGGRQEIVIRVRHEYPDGRVAREQLIKYAVDTGRTPAQLWPATS